MQLRLGNFATITFGTNGKYVKNEDCVKTHKEDTEHLDRKLMELTLDRNQKLIELKADLIQYMNIKFEMLRK